MRGSIADLGSLLATGLRGLRSRSLLTVGSVLLAAIGVAAAVVGPMYQSASAASYLVAKLRLEPDFVTGVTIDYSSVVPASGEQAKKEAGQAVDPSAVSKFRPPELSLWSRQLPVDTFAFAVLDARAVLTSAPDCRGLVVSGRCPAYPGEVLLLKFDAAHTGTEIGDRLDVSGLPKPLIVVGTYRVSTRDLGGFADPSRFTSILPQPTASGYTPYFPAPFVVAPETLTSLKPSRSWGDTAAPRSWFVRMDYQLRTDATTTLSDLQTAVREVSRLDRLQRAPAAFGVLSLEDGNQLASVVEEARQRRDTAQQTVTPAVLSLILVALVLLVRLLAAAMDLRRPELALASLRGIGRRQLWVLGLLEPVLMLVVAAALGLVAGYLGARGLAALWLVPGLPLHFGLSSVVFALGVVAAALAMAALTVRSALGEPLSAQIAGVRRPVRASRWTLVLRLGVVAAAVVVLVTTLSSGQQSKPAATDLLLPIVLAVAAGLLTTLGAALAAGWQATRSVRRSGVARYVASRTIARRREGTWAILPLTVALAIAVFAAGVYATAANWRASEAATEIGADASYQVDIPLAQALALTHQIDPQGKWLMAAAANADANGQKVLVDAPRFARVAVWPDSWTPGSGAAEVSGSLSSPRPALVLRGRRLTVTVDNAVKGDSSGKLLTLTVTTPTGESRSVIVGPFPRGTSTRSTSMPCAGGCEVGRLAIGGPGPFAVPMSGALAVTRVQVDGTAMPYFAKIGWRDANTNEGVYGPAAVTAARVRGSTLTVALDSAGESAVARLSPADVPAALPVLLGRTATPQIVSRSGGALTVATSAQVDVTLRPVATTESTAFFGPSGLLMDATMYTRTVPLSAAETQVYILARADTPPRIVTALADHGVTSPVRLGEVRRTLDQDAYALALNLYLAVTVLVILLALAGLAVNMAVQIPARRRDAASLRVVGLPRRSIVTAVVAELTAVLGAAAVAGILAGALAQYVVVRTLTLGYAEDVFTPRVLPSLDLPTVTGLLVAAFVLLLGVAVVLGNLTIRGARTATLRENAA